jgi:nitrile hydratase subunit beta
MDGIADLGGTDGWGPVPRPRPDEPVFPEAWQGRAFALSMLAWRVAGQNVFAFRHGLENQDHDSYFGQGYFGRWINAAEICLINSAILAADAIDARARNICGEQVEEPAVPEPNKPDYVSSEASLRTIKAAPLFAVGERVRARDYSTPGHSRLPRYVRTHVGVVDQIRTPQVFPDTHAHFRGENAQHLYSVLFESTELWPPGPGTDSESFDITVELFETYLEKVA